MGLMDKLRFAANQEPKGACAPVVMEFNSCGVVKANTPTQRDRISKTARRNGVVGNNLGKTGFIAGKAKNGE